MLLFLPCSVPPLDVFLVSNVFIIGALLRPTLENGIFTGAVDGDGMKNLSAVERIHLDLTTEMGRAARMCRHQWVLHGG